MYVYVYIHTYIYIYIYMYVCICMHVCMYGLKSIKPDFFFSHKLFKFYLFICHSILGSCNPSYYLVLLSLKI